MKFARIIPLFLAFGATCASASGSYDFCVDRVSPAKREILHVRFKFGDIDPGKEAARVIISQRYRKADTTEVGVTDYNEATCNKPEVEEVTVRASAEQIQNLANAIGSGNIPGAAIVASEIAAGTTVAVVKGAGEFAGGIVEGAKKIICGIFGC